MLAVQTACRHSGHRPGDCSWGKVTQTGCQKQPGKLNEENRSPCLHCWISRGTLTQAPHGALAGCAQPSGATWASSPGLGLCLTRRGVHLGQQIYKTQHYFVLNRHNLCLPQDVPLPWQTWCFDNLQLQSSRKTTGPGLVWTLLLSGNNPPERFTFRDSVT